MTATVFSDKSRNDDNTRTGIYRPPVILLKVF